MAKKKTKKKVASTTVKNCTFAGVQYDAKACEAIMVVAEGLRTNAHGLATLARVFEAQEITIECLLKME